MTEKADKKAEETGKKDKISVSEEGSGRKVEKKKSSKAKIADLNDRLLRMQADFDNYRKRTIREKSDVYQRANEDIMLELLSVLDHFDLTLAAISQHQADDAFKEGVMLVSEQLRSVLKKYGLSHIEADGKQFDPNVHEAISHLPSDDVPSEVVISEARAGYMFGSKLLRASQVVVSKGKEE